MISSVGRCWTRRRQFQRLLNLRHIVTYDPAINSEIPFQAEWEAKKFRDCNGVSNGASLSRFKDFVNTIIISPSPDPPCSLRPRLDLSGELQLVRLVHRRSSTEDPRRVQDCSRPTTMTGFQRETLTPLKVEASPAPESTAFHTSLVDIPPGHLTFTDLKVTASQERFSSQTSSATPPNGALA